MASLSAMTCCRLVARRAGSSLSSWLGLYTGRKSTTSQVQGWHITSSRDTTGDRPYRHIGIQGYSMQPWHN